MWEAKHCIATVLQPVVRFMLCRPLDLEQLRKIRLYIYIYGPFDGNRACGPASPVRRSTQLAIELQCMSSCRPLIANLRKSVTE